jgi:hypothetical protein
MGDDTTDLPGLDRRAGGWILLSLKIGSRNQPPDSEDGWLYRRDLWGNQASGL